MKPSQILVLSRSQIERLISLKDAISVVEQAFKDFALGKATNFPVIREKIEPFGGFFGVKAGYLSSQGYLGYKGGGFWRSNPKSGLAAHQSVIVLYHPETGLPLAVMDGNYLTVIRTGAAGAIAARYLAKPDSTKVAIIGTGTQANIQLASLLTVLPVEEICCYGTNPESAQKFAVSWRNRQIHTIACSAAEEAVQGADIIVTTTPSFQPIILEDWVSPGTHINAIGSDTRGKQEIDHRILGRAKVVVDSWDQAKELGESQHAFREGLIKGPYAEIGEIVAQMKPGRENDSEITVFDSTGMAIQDLAVAAHVFQAAQHHRVGICVDLSGSPMC